MKRLKIFARRCGPHRINVAGLGLFSGFGGLPQICSRPKLL